MVRGKKSLLHCTLAISAAALAFALLVLAIVGCAPQLLPSKETGQSPNGINQIKIATPVTEPTVTEPPVPAWERDWLKGTPCRPPCWEGITPGFTTGTEAEQLLRQNTGKLTRSVNYPWNWDGRNSDGGLNWDWQATGGGSAWYQPRSSIVTSIRSVFPHAFTLQDVRSAYGEPSDVLAMASRDLERLSLIHYTFDIIYKPQGFYVEWTGPEPGPSPVIKADMPLHVVEFFEKNDEGLGTALGNPAQIKYLQPWKGILDWKQYCLPMDNGRGVDPSVCTQ